MSLETYPLKEKRATDINAQMAWLVREMGYSRDKTKGYEEKLVRLGREPHDPQSVFGFMSGYWQRFRLANDALNETGDEGFVAQSLQANAKVVAGLCDKVAFALWLQGHTATSPEESEALLDTALGQVRQGVSELDTTYIAEQLLPYNDKTFADNPMGVAILGLHAAFSKDAADTETLRTIALEGSAIGVLMWQAYAHDLEARGYSVEMPQPGISSGNIEAWTN